MAVAEALRDVACVHGAHAGMHVVCSFEALFSLPSGLSSGWYWVGRGRACCGTQKAKALFLGQVSPE